MVLRGQGVFEAFKQFAKIETEKAGRLSKGSNKAGSYYNFLVRLTIGIETNTKVQITNLGSFETYLIYEQFMKQVCKSLIETRITFILQQYPAIFGLYLNSRKLKKI